jgi:hypothetical protein
MDNTQRVIQILTGATNILDIPIAQKAEVLRLFLVSVELAHLQAAIVDNNGNPIDVTIYKYAGVTSLVIQLKDLKGNVLATVDPTQRI